MKYIVYNAFIINAEIRPHQSVTAVKKSRTDD